MRAKTTNFNEFLAVYVKTLKAEGMRFVYFDGDTVSCPECGNQFTVEPRVPGIPACAGLKVRTLGIGLNCPVCTTYFKGVPKTKREIK
jgi:hypothetical protein